MKPRFNLLLLLLILALSPLGCGFFAPATYDASQYNAIHEAALNGNVEKLNGLLHDNPELLSKVDYDKNTLLHLAAKHNRLDALNYLLSKGADVNARNAKNMTALHFAAQQGFEGIAKALLSHNADVTIKDSRDWTALVWAEKSHHTNVVNLLIGR